MMFDDYRIWATPYSQEGPMPNKWTVNCCHIRNTQQNLSESVTLITPDSSKIVTLLSPYEVPKMMAKLLCT